MIMLADTISDPWAMMVHSFDTGFANFTMVSSCLFDIAAFLTPTVLEQMTHLLAMNRCKKVHIDLSSKFILFSEIFELFLLFSPSFQIIDMINILNFLQ